MNRLHLVLYTAMAVWLITASGARVAFMLNAGLDLDFLPLVGFTLGATSLAALIPIWEKWHYERRLNKINTDWRRRGR